jgi:putative intracellular protease/amidase
MKIALLVYDRFTATDIIGPYEILNALPGAEVCFVAKERGPVMVDSGAFALVAPYSLADVAQADVLVVPGSSSGTMSAAADPALIAWVQQIHATSKWTTSVCTGALILAQAGILRGLPATTHWGGMKFLDRMGGALPRPEERMVRNGKIITAAGVSAGIDMALYLAGEIAGREQAEAIQLMLEYDPRPCFQSGHMSKASEPVRALANKEMWKASLSARESWAILRLVGQSFTSLARRKLNFTIEAPRSP